MMKTSHITEVVTPILEARGLELDDLEIASAGRRSVVRVVVDGDGDTGRGPNLDDISVATREISHALDEAGVGGTTPYTLEVTSRGTSRPMTRPQHWQRNLGHLVRLGEPDNCVGRIKAADETGADIEIDGIVRRIEFASVGKATIEVELTKPAKEQE